MIRAMLLNPLAVALSAVVGIIVCRMAHVDPHLHEMAFAVGATLIASEAAMIPMILFRNATVAPQAQAALGGMVIHLLLSIMLAAIVFLAAGMGKPFGFWMLVLYWVTLPVVSLVYVKALRSAPTGSPTAGTGLR